MKVFIGHSCADAQEFAAKLAAWLRREGFVPGLDVEDGMPAGAPFDIRIEPGTEGSDLTISLPNHGRERLVVACWDEYLRGVKEMSVYSLAWLPYHLIEARRWDDLERLLTDLSYLEAKTMQVSVFDMADDLANAVAALPAERPQRRILGLLEKAIRRDIHWIARHKDDYPQGLFQCLWNHGWWYDCPEAAKHYFAPSGGWKQPPPWERSGPKLCALLERWREEKESRQPGFHWLRDRRPPIAGLGSALKITMRGHEKPVECVSFSPDGRRIASGSADNTVRVWDPATGKCLGILRGHEDEVNSVAFSPDGRWIASGANDRTVRVWDAVSGMELAVLCGHHSAVKSVTFSPDGQRVASESHGNTVRLWAVRSGEELAILHTQEGTVMCAALSPKWRRIATGLNDSTVRLWDVESAAEYAALRGHEKCVNSVAFSPTGLRLASGADDGTVRLWDTGSGAELAVLHGSKDAIWEVVFSSDGRRIAGRGSWNNTVHLWDAETGAEVAALREHDDLVMCVAFSPNGSRLATGSSDETVRLWDAGSGKAIAVLHGHEGPVRSVTYSPDGRRIVSGANDGTVRLWDAEPLSGAGGLVDHTENILSLAFSSDGGRVATSGGWSQTIRLWDAQSGEQLAVLISPHIYDGGSAFPVGGTMTMSADWDYVNNAVDFVDESNGESEWVRESLGLSRRFYRTTGGSCYHCRGSEEGDETVIERFSVAGVIARFPMPLRKVISHPSGRTWAGIVSNHLYLLTLEGGPPP